MRGQETPRDRQRKTVSIDFGSFSTKLVSEDSRASFYSIAANVPTDMNQPITDPDTHDLDILNSPRKMAGRWVIGKQATYYSNIKRFTRSMRRFADPLYDVFMCAALRAAFPTRRRDLTDLRNNRGVVKHQWRIPVYVVVSIAPGYYTGNAPQLIEAVKGHYDFVDRQNNHLYTFNVERVLVVFEGWGIYSSKIYGMDDNQQIVRLPGAAKYVHSNVAIFDAGGRTTDIAFWREGKPDERMVASGDEGIILTTENIIKNMMSLYGANLPNQPDVLEIISAMEKRDRNGVRYVGAHGKRLDITEVVDAGMNDYASKAMELYENILRSGQGMDALVFGGGGSVLLRPYLEKAIPFERKFTVAKNMKGMYMANAFYTFCYAMYKQLQESTNG